MADTSIRLDRRRFLGAATGTAGLLAVAVVLPGALPAARASGTAPSAPVPTPASAGATLTPCITSSASTSRASASTRASLPILSAAGARARSPVR
ncbi:MAG: hypothetical protein IT481_13370 [Gammaproteobacteria bacterium]|nr:hypothetical protein [Gammaproteobacteria bacterium]